MKRFAPLLLFLPLPAISAVVGYFVSRSGMIHWLSASLVVASFMIMWGTWSFEDDAKLSIELAKKEGSSTADLESDIEKNNTINSLLILCLWGMAVLYEMFS